MQNVDLENPKRDQFTEATYERAQQCLAILLVLINGQRAQFLEIMSIDDCGSVRQNEYDKELYSMELQTFKAKKDGKKREPIHISMDVPSYRLLLKVKAMRSLYNNESRKFFITPKGETLKTKEITKFPVWNEFDFPPLICLTVNRRFVTSFYGKVIILYHYLCYVLCAHEIWQAHAKLNFENILLLGIF